MSRNIFSSSSPIELQNCLEEARQRVAGQNAEVMGHIRRFTGDGLHVVVSRSPAYCRSTDAIAGEHLSILGAYGSYKAAEGTVNAQEPDGETYQIYSPEGFVRPGAAPVAVAPAVNDEVPF
jgi:hypothetical protein